MRNLISEFIATFCLVFCGTGAIVINEFSKGTITHVGIAATFGLVIIAMAYAFGEISGAHMNPAVTAGFAVSGRLPWSQVPGYMLSQFAGAFVASGILTSLFPNATTLGETLPAAGEMQSFALEIILTFILMLVIMQVATGSKKQGLMAGIAIGAVIGLEVAFAGPASGGSMNPARSLAPGLLNGQGSSLWIYMTAPFIGAMLAVGVHSVLYRKPPAERDIV